MELPEGVGEVTGHYLPHWFGKVGANCFDGDYGARFEIAKDGEYGSSSTSGGDPDEHRRLEYTKGTSST